jgi:hypothetical protein
MKTTNQIVLIFSFLCLFSGQNPVSAQEKPPRPMSISKWQDLSFGAFSPGLSGGDVTINSSGGRTVTAGIIEFGLSYPFHPAVFEIDGEPGTLISWISTSTILTGSNGGSIELRIEASANPYISTVSLSGTIRISIGGTLTVGNPMVSPPGSYSGSFSITFIQE